MQTDLAAKRTLQPVTKRCEHHPDGFGFLGKYHFISSTFVINVPGYRLEANDVIAAITAVSDTSAR